MRQWRRDGGVIHGWILTACLCLALPLSAVAQEAAPTNDDATTGADITPLGVATGGDESLDATPSLPVLPVLVFDRARILSDSLIGQAFEDDIEKARADLIQENNEIYNALEEEEAELSDLRPTLSEEAFAQKADAFDQKVTAVRAAQDRKSAEIQTLYDTKLQAVEQEMNEALSAVAREVRALVVFERQQVYMMSGAIDVSSEIIRRLDAHFVLDAATQDTTVQTEENSDGAAPAEDAQSPSPAEPDAPATSE
ncbi:OmpH family outer membrane protein [Celeribacter sp.]|uniref:OmpH family outer membrane protein n=1 Tax=Celeribacter sp. TaxID=1890673 RepID=UPI003A92E8A2